jgi:tetratricopeptide (TPR) repeat protein
MLPGAVWSLWLSIVVVGHLAAASPAAPVRLADVEQAALTENWTEVLRLLDGVDGKALDPVFRLIKGHACLAMNQNNESVNLFLSTMGNDDLRAYQDWAARYASRHLDSPIAQYFAGDALARQGKWDAAVEAFNRADKLRSPHPLVLNARGVTYAQQGRVSEARVDFHAASLSNPQLADAHANIGALRIQTKEGADGAMAAFRRAQQVSKQFALAVHGKACIELIKGMNEGKQDFGDAVRLAGAAAVVELMLRNGVRYAATVGGADPDVLLADARKVGTAFSRRYDELGASAANWQSTSDKLHGMSWLPFNQRLADFAGNRAVERLEQIGSRYGTSGVSQWFDDHASQKQSMLAEVQRVGGYNTAIQGTERAVRDVGRTADIIGSTASLGLLASGAGSESALVSGAFALSGKMTAFGADKTLDWSTTHANFANSITEKYGLPTTPGGFDAGSSRGTAPGGVEISLAEINWDEGRWPFLAYYGLAYGLTQPAELPGPSPSREEKTHADVP